MRINHNISSLSSTGALYRVQRQMGTTIRNLSTGLRINSAADDAAGLGISENLRSQVRGANQARKNALDGISLLQIGDGAMEEIHNLLQRGRELSLQSSNDTLTATERTYIQQEITALADEIDRIASVTNYNGIKVLESSVDATLADAITEGLQTTWLNDAEALIQAQYGLGANGADMSVHLESSISWAAAYVQYSSVGQPMEMHIDTSSPAFTPGFDAATNVDGGSAPFYSDRVIAHEMVHAVLAQNIAGAGTLPVWFNEGAAELIHGADDRLKNDLGTATPSEAQAAAFTNANRLDGAWSGTSAQYSTAYAAARYLHSNAAGGFSTVLASLAGGSTLDAAIGGNTAFADTATFINSFHAVGVGSGSDYIANSMTFDPLAAAETDTGAIGNLDADGGAARNAQAVINNNVTAPDLDPTGFDVSFAESNTNISLWVDASSGNASQLQITTPGLSKSNLGVDTVSVATQTSAVSAISTFTAAIEEVSARRADFGALINRLGHVVNNLITAENNQQLAESQIRDADFAAETANLTRQQILNRSSMSMLSQANVLPQGVLSLLR